MRAGVGVRLTGAVMAHPQRREAAERLANGVFDVVTDPDPTGRPSAFRTSLLAWSSIPETSTHHLLLHDDMVLSSTFFERAERAATAMPHAALALFAFWNSRNGAAVRMGALAGARWVPGAGEYTPVAALLLPRQVALGYVEWARDKADTWPDDVLMGRYLREAGVPVYVAVPSLAEHEDLASLVDNDFQGLRRSPYFLPDDPETHENLLPELPVIPFLKRGVAQCAVRTSRWRDIRCEDYLSGLGLSTAGQSPLWTTAYTMGVVLRSTPEGNPADRVLATMGPGGYCHAMGARELGQRTASLLAEARDGLAAGLAASPRPVQRPSVTVTGAGFVHDHLVHALADRGYPAGSDVLIEVRQAATVTVTRAGRVTELRLGVPYGPGMPPSSPLAELVLRSSLNQPMHVSGPPLQLVHLRDVAEAVAAAIESSASGVFDIANPEPTSMPDLAEAIRHAVRPVPVTLAPDTPTGGRGGVGGEAARGLGWRAEVDLDYGLHTYAQWLAYESLPE